ncbi:hypothetical protein C8R46DRAFT_383617 [Mycena filopes]|nr:hypothetical protein C8R46DRAFT_383617 [Mycena filopes]
MKKFFKPGPLLLPDSPTPDASFASFSCRCVNKQYDLDRIATVRVGDNGLIFTDKDASSVFQKSYKFLPTSFWDFSASEGVEDGTLLFPCVSTVWDDLAVGVKFEDDIACDKFVRAIKIRCPLPRAIPAVETKFYIMDASGTAKRLTGHDHLRRTINFTLNALAASDAAELLAPVYDWSVNHDQLALDRARQHIQSRLQSSRPPLVIFVQSGEGFPAELVFRDDEEGAFASFQTLPEKPTWGLSTISPPAGGWLQQIINNYGVHRRRRGADPSIFISMDLLQWYLAACKASLDAPMSDAALHSLLAATACLQVTIIHEVSHLWVTLTTEVDDSPPRANVKGADAPAFDVAVNKDEAEDDADSELIEAGNLVETVWLGGLHRLVLDNDGWLQFVVCRSAAVLNPPNVEVSSAKALTPPPASPTPPPSESSDEASTEIKDEEDDDSDDSFPRSPRFVPKEPSEALRMLLGPPIQLKDKSPPPTVMHGDEMLEIAREPDRVLHVQTCTSKALQQLCALGVGVARFPDEMMKSTGLTMLVRSKKESPRRPLPRLFTTQPSAPLPSTQLQMSAARSLVSPSRPPVTPPSLLIDSTTTVLLPLSRARRNFKWPSVLRDERRIV